MPSLGSDMESGTLVEWTVKPGDAVKRGDIVAVVETQKGAIEIECFEAGKVAELTAEIGQTLPVGSPMAVILAEGEAAPEKAPQPAAPPERAPSPAAEPKPAAPAPPAPAKAAPPKKPQTPPRPTPPPPPSGPIPVPYPVTEIAASPAARRAATERGVDLAAITGTGPGGAIQLADIDGAGPAPAATPMSPLEAMRSAIAAAMARSKREIPHYYLTHTVDLQPASDWLAAHNADRPPDERLLLGTLVFRAAALAAKTVPAVNGRYEDGAFHPSETVNAGLAVALRGGGLVAPAIMETDTLPLPELMAAMRDVVTRARTGRLRNSEMTQGTITISSLGEKGVEAMTGVIYPPQVAILCIGAPQTRPWLVDGAVEPRLTIALALSADHRVSDGRIGSKYLAEVESLLQTPEDL